MQNMNGHILALILIVLALGGGIIVASLNKTEVLTNNEITLPALPSATATLTPEPSLPEIPSVYKLTGATHVFQTFNNCGPASLSMALSLYGINITQKELGDELRPYQIASGDNDDKSVTLVELAEKAKDYGFIPYHRPNGDMEKAEQLVANGMPVITRTLLVTDEDIGHYRVITGYNSNTQQIIQNDSLQGKDLAYNYADYLALWKPYSYEYLVLVPKEKVEIVERILGDEVDPQVAWQNAADRLQQEIAIKPDDVQLKFSLAVAYYHLEEYDKTIKEFEAVESQLPFRTLWYQIEPLLAYQKLGRHEELLPRIEAILNRHNRAFSELYQIRGEVYLQQGKTDYARREFETALTYNKNYKPAKEALAML